jgi:predicted dehydrogenase
MGTAFQELKVGMIGYQFMGRAHSNALRSLPFYFDVKHRPVQQVLCGRNAAEVEKAAARMGWKEYETDWRRVIERDDIDVIDIVTPNHLHAEMAIAAALAGKHVICEKPLAMNVEQAQDMLRAVRESGVTAMVCHNYRFVPAVCLAKKLIEENRLGKIYHFRATYLQDWGMNPALPPVWRMRKELTGSGALGDIGSHIIDLARYLVGEIDEVVGSMDTFIARRSDQHHTHIVDVDDTVSFLARFYNGASGVFEASRFSAGNKNGNRIEINGEKGSIRWDLENLNLLHVYLTDDEKGLRGFRTIHCTDVDHPYGDIYWPAGLSIGYEHTFINLMKQFFDGINTGVDPKPDFKDGVLNQMVMAAVEQSVVEHTWIKVPSFTD